MLRACFFILGFWGLLTIFDHLLFPVSASPFSNRMFLPHYDYGLTGSMESKWENSGFYVTTGVHVGHGPNGSLPLRLEIRELEKDSLMWTLYILGLDMFQHTNQSEMLSWYQIAGIHGRPFIPFNDVAPTPGNQDNGYCNHVSNLFPTWHRPYVALYEQVIHTMIRDIALKYPSGSTRDQYVTAATNFRVPYWDWAAVPASGESVYPSSVTSPSVAVHGPAGKQTIRNPLYSYLFAPLDPLEFSDHPFDTYPETMRYPTDQAANAQSQNSDVASQLDNSASNFQSRLYFLLTNYHDYKTFSNEAWIPGNGPSTYDSLESLHDSIHGLTGNGGHMTYIYYSAFDPLFFLHHVQIDRLFAMWQVLNPNTYVEPEPATYATFTTSAGEIQDINTPLTPFYKDSSGNFWTSADARTTDVFGYTYPETSNVTSLALQKQVTTAINILYGPTAEKTLQRTRDLHSGRAKNRTLKHWFANMEVEKNAIGLTFFIHIFIGHFSPDPIAWSFDRNLVGTQAIPVKLYSSSRGAGRTIVSATMPLTDALLNHILAGELASLEDADVESYLVSNIKYRISMLNNTEVLNDSVPSLKISIASIVMQAPASNEELPVWGKMKVHMDVGTG